MKALDGSIIPIERSSEELKVGGARLTQTDLSCTNGVLHGVDGVVRTESR